MELRLDDADFVVQGFKFWIQRQLARARPLPQACTHKASCAFEFV